MEVRLMLMVLEHLRKYIWAAFLNHEQQVLTKTIVVQKHQVVAWRTEWYVLTVGGTMMK